MNRFFARLSLSLAVLGMSFGVVASLLAGSSSAGAVCAKNLGSTRLGAVLQPPTAEGSVMGTSDFNSYVQKTYGRYDITVSKGEGCTLTSTDGTTYLDFVAGIATTCLGHGNPALVKAVSDQMRKVNHVSNLYYISEQGKLAKWLVDNSPADKVSMGGVGPCVPCVPCVLGFAIVCED